MATFVRHARPFSQQHNGFLIECIPNRTKANLNKNCRRCYSQILQRSSRSERVNHRQLQNLIKQLYRFNSTEQTQKATTEAVKAITDTSSSTNVNYIPAPPRAPGDTLPPEMADISASLNALGEPSLQSLGLGSNWPPGLIQQAVEFFHVHLGLPWFGSVILLTTIVRILIFPVFVKQQKINAKMSHTMPTLNLLQAKARDATLEGDHLSASKYKMEASQYREKHGVGLTSMLTPLVQAPIFTSNFLGYRRMVELPVESLTTGGTLWFKDLTVPDPVFGLPLFTSATLAVIIKVGAETSTLDSMPRPLRYLMLSSPVIMFFFIQGFPSMMLVYWTTSNTISLIQAYFFSKPAVREYLGIPKRKAPSGKPPPSMNLADLKKKAKKGLKEMRIQSQMMDRERVNAEIFRKAGQGPVQETFYEDPTKSSQKKTKTKRKT